SASTSTARWSTPRPTSARRWYMHSPPSRRRTCVSRSTRSAAPASGYRSTSSTRSRDRRRTPPPATRDDGDSSTPIASTTTRTCSGVAGTRERVNPWRAAGLRTAVATTKKTLTAERVLEGLGIAEHFDLILGTEPPMPHKPAPDLLLACAERLGRDPARGLM